MNYKERIDALKSLFLSTEEPVKEVEVKEEVALAEDSTSEEKAPAEESTPAVEYVTLAQFAELREDTKKFMESVTEMLSSAMEMINSTEKNTVPVEASKEEEVELAAEAIVHDPEAIVTNSSLKVKIGAGANKTAGQRAAESWYEVANNLNN